ncbi:MAG: NADPH-dependent F420 reductase [Chloroflexota bacterium]
MTDENLPILVTIAVLGGTGKEGSGLAKRWANSGYRVIIGSRDATRAEQKADELNAEMGGAYLQGKDNLSAATEADLVVLSVPYDAHASTLETLRETLQGKILVDVTVPLLPPNVRTVHVPEGKSACLEAQKLLGPGVKVVAAFQNVSAVHLKDAHEHVECDVLICGDDDAAKGEVIKLAQAAGLRGLDAGPLENSVAVEAITPMLLWLNKRYKVKSAGIVITGINLGADLS